jgi:hypothetical protein
MYYYTLQNKLGFPKKKKIHILSSYSPDFCEDVSEKLLWDEVTKIQYSISRAPVLTPHARTINCRVEAGERGLMHWTTASCHGKRPTAGALGNLPAVKRAPECADSMFLLHRWTKPPKRGNGSYKCHSCSCWIFNDATDDTMSDERKAVGKNLKWSNRGIDHLCGPSSWLQIRSSRVPFPALPDFLSSSGSGTGSTQPRGYNWGVNGVICVAGK